MERFWPGSDMGDGRAASESYVKYLCRLMNND